MTIPYDGYERLDLTKGMRHKDMPDGPDNEGWFAGEQMEALEYYAPHNFSLLGYITIGNYDGDIYGIGRWLEPYPDRKYRWILLRDSFGTCSGCDALEGGRNGYEYVEDVLKNNTLQFLTLDDLMEYIRETEVFFWSNECVKEHMLEIAESIKHILETDLVCYCLKVAR